MTTTTAMPEPLGWYVVNNIGMATLCKDEAEAQLLAEDCDMVYKRQAPHRAVQLVAIATLQSQPAEVKRPQAAPVGFDVEAMLRSVLPGGSYCDPQAVADAIRDYVAASPQAVPMTDEQILKAMSDAGWPQHLVNHVSGAREFTAALARRRDEAHGITAQGAQGGEG